MAQSPLNDNTTCGHRGKTSKSNNGQTVAEKNGKWQQGERLMVRVRNTLPDHAGSGVYTYRQEIFFILWKNKCQQWCKNWPTDWVSSVSLIRPWPHTWRNNMEYEQKKGDCSFLISVFLWYLSSVRVIQVPCRYPVQCQGYTGTMQVSWPVSGLYRYHAGILSSVRVIQVPCRYPDQCQGYTGTMQVSWPVSGLYRYHVGILTSVRVCWDWNF